MAAERSKHTPSTAGGVAATPGFGLAPLSAGAAGAAVYGTVCFQWSGICPTAFSHSAVAMVSLPVSCGPYRAATGDASSAVQKNSRHALLEA